MFKSSTSFLEESRNQADQAWSKLRQLTERPAEDRKPAPEQPARDRQPTRPQPTRPPSGTRP